MGNLISGTETPPELGNAGIYPRWRISRFFPTTACFAPCSRRTLKTCGVFRRTLRTAQAETVRQVDHLSGGESAAHKERGPRPPEPWLQVATAFYLGEWSHAACRALMWWRAQQRTPAKTG